ncbi:hypothetical protein HMPREF0872_05950 [Veillonella montpellierensis DNF00314]|uniref:Iron ABC transporter permease n=1 Tax=Veillonella montpellierensis DNF00314 TaxID=1401067 RepID=A0A096AJ00_9FIRM|nr:iron ABC transporter permease [Veillonella montpellierensis]KGF47098.1 hypothetical protein HMPREF0872_05950 [Veillonella montpellierensis DNF00314]
MLNIYTKALGLIVAICASFILSIGLGSVSIPLHDVLANIMTFLQTGTLPQDIVSTILWEVRVPRTLFAMLCGIGLSLCGLVLQTVTRNDLADPYILGVSSGAGFGAVGTLIYGWLAFMTPYDQSVGAFVGAALSMLAVVLLSGKQNNITRLVLVGIGISALFSALTMVMIYAAPHENQVRSAMFWLLGSFSGIQWSAIPITSITVIGTFLILFFLHHDLDILLLGHTEAQYLGLPIKRIQLTIILVTSICISVLVAHAGIIGFIGLITPHLARFLIGPKHKSLLVFTSLISALLMIWADVVARSAFRPEELPIGVLTSIVGAPLFIWIVCRHQRGGSSC